MIDRAESLELHFLICLIGTCTDTDNGATDTGFDGCAWYDNNLLECGNYDDDDFVSNEVCCACGGIFSVIWF